MSDLLAAFRVEAAEHLDAADKLLAAAEWEEPDASAIAALFRAVHSLKGLARIVGAPGMEALGHTAEEALGAVRAGRRRLDPALVALLMRAADALRGASTLVPETAWAPDPALVATLERAAREAGESSAARAGPRPAWSLLNPDRDLLLATLELLETEILPAIADGAALPTEDMAVLRHACGRVGLAGMALALDQEPAEMAASLAAAAGRLALLLHGAAPMPPLPPPSPAAPPGDALEALGLGTLRGLPEILPAAIFEVAVPWPDDAAAQQALLADAAGAMYAQLPPEGEALLLLLGADSPATWPAVPDGAPPPRLLTPQAPSLIFAPPRAATTGPKAADNGVRVPVEVLDRLFGRIGQFFGVGARLTDIVYDEAAPEALTRLGDMAALRLPDAVPQVARLRRFYDDVAAIQADVAHYVSLIHDATLGLRVIPLETLFDRFPRMVRETARSTGKTVRFVSDSSGIQVDKGMVDLLADPLSHILRNAVDHGIEAPPVRVQAGKPPAGLLRLSATQRGNRIIVEIAEDGQGLNIDRIRAKAIAAGLTSEAEAARLSDEQVARFIFAAGLSTKDAVTDTSGRGVGMDVVLVNITRLGGRIDIQTAAGKGTTFRLDLPLSAAVQPMLLATTGVQGLAFPEAMVEEVVAVPPGAVQPVNGQPAVLLHGRFLPLFEAHALLDLPAPVGDASVAGERTTVVCRLDGRRIGVTVARVHRRSEMLVRETHPRVAALPGVGGVTLLGADRIVLIVDPEGLFELAARSGTRGLRAARPGVAAV